jgi:hypothetical protein
MLTDAQASAYRSAETVKVSLFPELKIALEEVFGR